MHFNKPIIWCCLGDLDSRNLLSALGLVKRYGALFGVISLLGAIIIHRVYGMRTLLRLTS